MVTRLQFYVSISELLIYPVYSIFSLKPIPRFRRTDLRPNRQIGRNMTFLFALILVGTLIVPVPLRTASAQAPLSEFSSCVDLSFLDEMEAAGATYYDNGLADDAMAIFKRRGINMVRLRLWHSPPAGTDGLTELLAMAQRAHTLDMDLLVDLHYSDTWADPGQQTKPAAWSTLDFPVLVDSMAAYSKRVIQSLVDQGTPPLVVQIGNEITGGLLWDDGRVGGAFDTARQWDNLAALLNAAIDGVHQASPETAIMIHIDRGGDSAATEWFFDNLATRNVSPDIIGLSFYPWWHGTLEDLETTINVASTRYDVPVFVVETAYPWTLEWFDDAHNIVGLEEQLLPGYGANRKGQTKFIEEVIAVVNRQSPRTGSGVCYWAPDYVSAPGMSSPWENLALFNDSGEVLQTASALGEVTLADVVTTPNVQNEITIFPNPAASQISIQHPATSTCSTLAVFDRLGRRVLRQHTCNVGSTETSVTIDHLPAGTYFVMVTDDRNINRATGSFVVVR